jgi:hypothetical protein
MGLLLSDATLVGKGKPLNCQWQVWGETLPGYFEGPGQEAGLL